MDKKEVDYSKMCQKDEAHQREWNEFFEKCFNEKGEFLENNAESKAVLARITERKTEKTNVVKASKQSTQNRTFGWL